MQIQINGHIAQTEALTQHIEKEVTHAVRHFPERVTRVEVHLHDENAEKHGKDKRVVLEARPAGHQPMTVTHDGTDMYDTIHQTAKKLERALDKMFAKLDGR